MKYEGFVHFKTHKHIQVIHVFFTHLWSRVRKWNFILVLTIAMFFFFSLFRCGKDYLLEAIELMTPLCPSVSSKEKILFGQANLLLYVFEHEDFCRKVIVDIHFFIQLTKKTNKQKTKLLVFFILLVIF